MKRLVPVGSCMEMSVSSSERDVGRKNHLEGEVEFYVSERAKAAEVLPNLGDF